VKRRDGETAANSEWRVANGKGQGAGGKGRGKRRDGETVKRRNGETVRRGHGETEIYALRFTHHEVITYAIQTNRFRRHACP
jgi:uncharacterized protein YgiB involved in biofilm formation